MLTKTDEITSGRGRRIPPVHLLSAHLIVGLSRVFLAETAGRFVPYLSFGFAYLLGTETSPVILFFTISLITLPWSFLLILNRFVLRLGESSICLTPAARRVTKEIQNLRQGGFTGIICVDGLGGLSTVLVVPKISELTEDAVARSNPISHNGGRLKSISSLSKRDTGDAFAKNRAIPDF